MSRFPIVFLSILLKFGAAATVNLEGKKIFHHENILECQNYNSRWSCYYLLILFTPLVDNAMPNFEEIACTHQLLADTCIKVSFSNGLVDILILTKIGATPIFEGFLQEDTDVRAVMIDTPSEKTRLVSLMAHK